MGKTTDLSQVNDKLYNIMPVVSSTHRLNGFELATLVVILCTDYVCSCKSNYPTITAKTAPWVRTNKCANVGLFRLLSVSWFMVFNATFNNISVISWWLAIGYFRPERNEHEPHSGEVFSIQPVLCDKVWQLPVQSVPIITKVASSIPVNGEVYSIHYKFVSDFRQVGGFLHQLKLTAMI
jgi:hypothetical protein